MKKMNFDIAVIGGGPAGLAAAIQARKEGAEKVLVIERDVELGGILQQCIHDGFGLHRFGKRMSGNEYAQEFIDELETTDIEVLLDTMVLEVTQDKVIYACNNNCRPKEEWKQLATDYDTVIQRELYISETYTIRHEYNEEGLITGKYLMSKETSGGRSFY